MKSLNIPDYLSQGEKARLIPVAAESSKEVKATSVLLATLSAVHEFAANIFSAVGLKVGKRTDI